MNTPHRSILTIIAILIGVVVLAVGCKNTNDSEDSMTSIRETKAAKNQTVAPYDLFCADCHGQLAASNKAKRSQQAINYAIEQNKGNEIEGYMGVLTGLIDKTNPDQGRTRQIADALVGVDLSLPSQTDGRLLYDYLCSGCHNDLEMSDIPRRNGKSILWASMNVAEMNFLLNISDTVINVVASELTQLSLPAIPATDGEKLYTSYCRGCHGTPATTDVPKSNQSTTDFVIKNLSIMQFLSFLSEAEISAITTTLATTDGDPTHIKNCGKCHR